jgi:hypothetical protein
MARIITKQLAEDIVRKLGATKHSKKNRPHDLYTFSYPGQVIARFGLRRGSAKDQGHDHIPGQIHLSPHDAKAFGECRHTLEWYIQTLIDKGVIEEE